MKRNKKTKRKSSSYSKLSLFQKPGIKFFRPCPLSGKDAPTVDYKNIKLLRKYISESGRILPSRVTSVSQKKQKELSKAIFIMEVVLLENIKNLGQIGDVVNVKRGHGRNFLIKYGKALKASKENINLVNEKKAQLKEKNLELKKSAKKLYETLPDYQGRALLYQRLILADNLENKLDFSKDLFSSK